MRLSRLALLVFVVALAYTAQSRPASAAVIAVGDVLPRDPGTWEENTPVLIGQESYGEVIVDAGSQVKSLVAHIGYLRGDGVATVTGGAIWEVSGMFVGTNEPATGLLNVTDGGSVFAAGFTIGSIPGSAGLVTVNNGALWGDALQVGAGGYGMLNITNGGSVHTAVESLIGRHKGSAGSVTVSGPGSTWTTGRVYIADGRYTVFVGDAMGRLNVTDGGTVSGSGGCIGYGTDSVGEVMVSGAGSTWDNSGGLTVGWNGRGTLYVVAGGSVSATDVTINALSTVGVYGGSLIVNGGSGTITNDGRIHITAAVNAPPGTTQPISAALWQGSGTYSAIGGKWNSTTHQLAVSDALQGASGAPISVDLFDTQRLLIHDPATDWSLGAGFTATDAPTTLTLSASAISGSTLSDLQSLLRPGESLLGGWQITPTSGYTPGDPAYLSFAVGAGRSAEDLFVWHYDGTWSRFDAADLTYDGNYASFTVTGFSDYAISAVPEPSTLALLASALLCAAVWAWRKKR